MKVRPADLGSADGARCSYPLNNLPPADDGPPPALRQFISDEGRTPRHHHVGLNLLPYEETEPEPALNFGFKINGMC